jgi:D-glycero-alpha-D-manno-heptose-7-phosphate kinase
MITARTPLRISLFGGGTDLPLFYKEHGGAVLGFAIDSYIYTQIRRVRVPLEWRHRIVWSKTELVQAIHEIEHPIVREAMRLLPPDTGIEMIHSADLPARTGLGSSSSFTVGVVNALSALKGFHVSPTALVDRAIHIEREILGEHGGDQDQTWAAHGGFNFIEFQPSGLRNIQPVICRAAIREGLQKHFMLVFTGLSRSASAVTAEQMKNFPARQATLHEMVDIARHARRRIECGHVEEIGPLLHETWMMKRSLASSVSTPEIDEVYEAAMKAGALGGKLLGAGGGGFMLFFVPPERQAAVRERLYPLKDVPFRIGSPGSSIIQYDDGERI